MIQIPVQTNQIATSFVISNKAYYHIDIIVANMELFPTKETFYDEEAAEETKGGAYEAIIPANAPVTLTWNNLTVKTRPMVSKDQKTLIDELNGSITGGFWAVMGSSGSGEFLIMIRCKLFYSSPNLDLIK